MWRFAAAFALSVGLALVVAGQTRATTPVIVTLPINETFIWDQSAICGFPVTETITGTVHIERFFDDTGALVREMGEEEETGTFTANGLTVTTAGHLVTVRDLVNGTVTVTGVPIHTSLPTGGTIYLDRGRLVFDVVNDTLMFAAKSRVQGDAADEGGRVTLWLALDGRRVGSTGCGVHLFDLPANRIDS